MKKIKWIALGAAVLLVAAVLLMSSKYGIVFCAAVLEVNETDTDVAHYEQYRSTMTYGREFMPDPEVFAQADDVRFAWRKAGTLLFISETMNLFLRYDPAEYAARKETALEGWTLISEPIYDNTHLVMAPEVEYQGYTLQAVQLVSHPTDASKYVGFIGTNDATCTICYLLFNDSNLGCIGEADEDPTDVMQRWMADAYSFCTFE